jgi:hypothetical protein
VGSENRTGRAEADIQTLLRRNKEQQSTDVGASPLKTSMSARRLHREGSSRKYLFETEGRTLVRTKSTPAAAAAAAVDLADSGGGGGDTVSTSVVVVVADHSFMCTCDFG